MVNTAAPGAPIPDHRLAPYGQSGYFSSVSAAEQCPSSSWRYRCDLQRGHNGFHQVTTATTSARWNDEEARLGYPRRKP